MVAFVNNPPDVTIFGDAAALAEGAARRIADYLRDHPGPRVTFAPAGGSTPAAAYRRLREMDAPWERVTAWVGDERNVPPGHPEHNGTMMDRLLLAGSGAEFRQIPWFEGEPERMAADYQKTLGEILPRRNGRPCPDLMLAGIGDDGHVLSLFPGSPGLEITDRDYAAVWAEAKGDWRLTATFPLAQRADRIMILASGEGKASALAEILSPTRTPALPARRLMEGSAPVAWLVDEAAASRWEGAG